ncbi:MAG: AraC family transcriptional regulator, partial [Lachnospiraceae bacterium]|nr:AraC family transcriptional regulator [Lachnospiraceae bacterium]
VEHKLNYTTLPITEIWLEAGFESQRTFNRVFKEKYHMSPREYRKNI